jgi:hypothetical protein
MGIPLIGSIPTERGFHLPDVFSQPELLTPRKQPQGKVKVDWSHPLSRGLKSAWVGGDCIHGPVVGEKRNRYIHNGAVFGGVDSSNEAPYFLDEVSYNVLMKVNLKSLNAGSDYFFVNGSYTSATNGAGLYAGIDTVNRVTVIHRRTTGSFYGNSGTVALTAGASYLFKFISLSTGIAYGYVYSLNGVLIDSCQTTASTRSSGGAGNILKVGRLDLSGSREEPVEWCYIWDRAIAPNLQFDLQPYNSITRDPYQFLIPVA